MSMSDFDDVIELIHQTRDKQMLVDLLYGLTTPKERHEFARRIDVVSQLIQGVPQLRIAQDLGVGVATVTRGSKELSLGRFKILRRQR